MATKEDRTVTFTLANDPQEYRLCYDFNEIADAEEVVGINLLTGVMGQGQGTMSSTQLRGLLYALLHKAHPEVTVKEAGELLTIDAVTVSTAFAEVMGYFSTGGTGRVNGKPVVVVPEPGVTEKSDEPVEEPVDPNRPPGSVRITDPPTTI